MLWKKKYWFTLLEIMVASAILSLTVFWVYKLIWENSRLIGNKDIFLQKNILIYNIKECLDTLWFFAFRTNPQSEYSFNFWATKNDCNTWSFSPDYSFTPVNMNGNDYFLYGKITNSGATFLDWELSIFEESTWKVSKNYKQVP